MIEPFRVKMVEPICLSTTAEREVSLERAGLNLFQLPAAAVTIDLLTDSGTSAMSANQWAAMLRGDESYAGARSWFTFRDTVRRVFGFEHVVPTHQGRAAERILFSLTVRAGDVVPSNAHFDTTRANVEYLGGVAVDLPCAAAAAVDEDHPFKGDADLERLEAVLKEKKSPLVMVTVTNNSGGGQPVSMQNIRGVSEIAKAHGVPFYVDACRFAENAWFIKTREAGYAARPVAEIVREMFSYADGCTMSAKKDGLANIGGFLCTRDAALAKQEEELLILTEGFPTYGGMAGRDLEAIAVGLEEVLHEDYLAYRVASTAYVGQKLREAGVPIVRPPGGHAIYVDARAFLPHVPPLQYPGQALAVELYRRAGIRGVEVGTAMFGYDPHTDTEKPAKLDLLRLAVPRRVYTQSHMDYVVQALVDLYQERHLVPGLTILHAPRSSLRHFSATFQRVVVS